MADIVFEQASKKYADGFIALKQLDLRIADGEFLVLVGPSGCGKSTALRMVAGLEEITSGAIKIGGRIVNGLAPRERNVAMVFQSYALYPHLSVRDNIGFGLRVRGLNREDIERKVAEAARILELEPYLDRKPARLSGGQRQRVAMGRAIVRNPDAFLMDEPLSNLDAKLRVAMRAEVTKIQRLTGVTTIYVTHDQIEAMTMGDRVAVLDRGVLQQHDTPRGLYKRPANLFVAGFIGSPAMNFVASAVIKVGEDLQLLVGSQRLTLRASAAPALRAYAGRTVTLGVRPEHLILAAEGAQFSFRAQVNRIEDLGATQLVSLSTIKIGTEGGADLLAILDGEASVHARETITLSIAPSTLHAFDPGTGLAIRPETEFVAAPQ